MKKLMLIGFVLLSTHCFSQTFVQGIMERLHFGLKAGVNYSNYTQADFNTQALVGFHAGALVDFDLTKKLCIQEEFLFSSQGAKVSEAVFGQKNVTVYYMTVPFLLKYRTHSGLYIEAGPQVGTRIKDNIDSLKNGNFAKLLDLSAAGGIGFQSKSGFGIGVRYVAGLSTIGDFKSSNISPDFRSSIIQASVFYIF
jgi:Outer membrane protein beta-barrel domain